MRLNNDPETSAMPGWHAEFPFTRGIEAMKSKTLLTALAVITTLAANAAQAAIINVPNFSFTPDGSNTAVEQDTNINVLNGGTNVLTTGTAKTVYLVTTITFGTDSDAHLRANFETAVGGADRLGILVQDNGIVEPSGSANGTLFGGTVQKRTTVNLGQDMAGQTITLLAKLHYDPNNDTTYGSTNTSEDTLMNIWINPTSSSVEGSGFSAGDLYALWNSAGFGGFEQRIENQSTPGTAGTSFIKNTVILTGADATFANALAIAIPEPGSLALLALGGLVSVLIVRRRMK